MACGMGSSLQRRHAHRRPEGAESCRTRSRSGIRRAPSRERPQPGAGDLGDPPAARARRHEGPGATGAGAHGEATSEGPEPVRLPPSPERHNRSEDLDLRSGTGARPMAPSNCPNSCSERRLSDGTPDAHFFDGPRHRSLALSRSRSGLASSISCTEPLKLAVHTHPRRTGATPRLAGCLRRHQRPLSMQGWTLLECKARTL